MVPLLSFTVSLEQLRILMGLIFHLQESSTSSAISNVLDSRDYFIFSKESLNTLAESDEEIPINLALGSHVLIPRTSNNDNSSRTRDDKDDTFFVADAVLKGK